MNDAHRFQPERLRQARGALSLEEIAVAVGVTARTVDNWERGRTEPDASALNIIARLTGRPLEWFFRRNRVA